VWIHADAAQFVRRIAHRFLAGTDHHVVHCEYLRPLPTGAEADVQTIVGDLLVVDLAELVDTLRFE
jgi:hypothetical protein